MKIIRRSKKLKISSFLKSVYGEEIFNNKVDKRKSNLEIYVKIYKMVSQFQHQFLMVLKKKM